LKNQLLTTSFKFILKIFTRAPPNFFVTLRHCLDLSLNELDKIEPHLFDKLTKLIYLYLTGNRLKFIDELSFKYLSNLNTLYLSSNELTGFQPNTFSELRQLFFLDLSSNRFVYLNDADFFTGLTSIRAIVLTNTSLIDINSNIFINFRYLTSVYLNSNFLNESKIIYLKNFYPLINFIF